jgi:hypothetical protein
VGGLVHSRVSSAIWARASVPNKPLQPTRQTACARLNHWRHANRRRFMLSSVGARNQISYFGVRATRSASDLFMNSQFNPHRLGSAGSDPENHCAWQSPVALREQLGLDVADPRRSLRACRDALVSAAPIAESRKVAYAQELTMRPNNGCSRPPKTASLRVPVVAARRRLGTASERRTRGRMSIHNYAIICRSYCTRCCAPLGNSLDGGTKHSAVLRVRDLVRLCTLATLVVGAIWTSSKPQLDVLGILTGILLHLGHLAVDTCPSKHRTIHRSRREFSSVAKPFYPVWRVYSSLHRDPVGA